MWKAGREAGCGLNGAEMELANVIAIIEAEGGANGVDGDAFRHAADVLVEGAGDIVEVRENEGFGWVKANANDVFGVLGCVASGVWNVEFRGVHVFFVVSQHDDKGNIEYFLEPSNDR